ncbi:MAG: hypothetical protein LZF60_350001 [Nitrospira sp.]|nr:MAG: hypothetical protein LZF60_350001 [Nitrospira sp.]
MGGIRVALAMTMSHALRESRAPGAEHVRHPAAYIMSIAQMDFLNRLGVSLVRRVSMSTRCSAVERIVSVIMEAPFSNGQASINSGPKYLFHGLYGRGTRGTIRGLPLGPGEGCVEIVQA